MHPHSSGSIKSRKLEQAKTKVGLGKGKEDQKYKWIKEPKQKSHLPYFC